MINYYLVSDCVFGTKICTNRLVTLIWWEGSVGIRYQYHSSPALITSTPLSTIKGETTLHDPPPNFSLRLTGIDPASSRQAITLGLVLLGMTVAVEFYVGIT